MNCIEPVTAFIEIIEPESSSRDNNDSAFWQDGIEVSEDILFYLKCPICLELMCDTVVVMSCLDRFCSSCIERCIRSDDIQSACPCCRKKIPSRRALRRDVYLDNIISHVRRYLMLAQTIEQELSANINDTSIATANNSDLAVFRKLHEERVRQMKNMQDPSRQGVKRSAGAALPSTVSALDNRIVMESPREVIRFYACLWPDVDYHILEWIPQLPHYDTPSLYPKILKCILSDMPDPYIMCDSNLSVGDLKKFIAYTVLSQPSSLFKGDEASIHYVSDCLEIVILKLDLKTVHSAVSSQSLKDVFNKHFLSGNDRQRLPMNAIFTVYYRFRPGGLIKEEIKR